LWCRRQHRRVDRAHVGRGAVLLPDLHVDLFAVHRDVARRADADAHLVTADVEHRDDDVVTDDDGLVRPAAEDQQQLATGTSGARVVRSRSASTTWRPTRVWALMTSGPSRLAVISCDSGSTVSRQSTMVLPASPGPPV